MKEFVRVHRKWFYAVVPLPVVPSDEVDLCTNMLSQDPEFLKLTDNNSGQTDGAGLVPDGRPHKCSVCRKGFTTRRNLHSHKKLHSSKRPFQCNVCGRGFKFSANRNQHERFHSEERPFKCNVCGRGFKLLSNRRRHETIHSEERPFKCNVCGRGFKRSTTRNIHQRTQHQTSDGLLE